jgi:hypothetical protein
MMALTIDASQTLKLIRTVGFIKNGIPRVLAPAINRTLDKGKTEVKREIRKVYVIKAKDIPVAVRHASVSHLEGTLTLSDRMLRLDRFKVTGGTRGRPLYAQVKRGHGGIISSGFRATMPNGYFGPFRRKPGVGRLPIKQLLTISAPIMASQPSVGPAVNTAMGETLAKRIDHEIKRVLASAKGK